MSKTDKQGEEKVADKTTAPDPRKARRGAPNRSEGGRRSQERESKRIQDDEGGTK